MFFAFYEAREPISKGDTPIVLWLQGGPGCSSFFGMVCMVTRSIQGFRLNKTEDPPGHL